MRYILVLGFSFLSALNAFSDPASFTLDFARLQRPVFHLEFLPGSEKTAETATLVLDDAKALVKIFPKYRGIETADVRLLVTGELLTTNVTAVNPAAVTQALQQGVSLKSIQNAFSGHPSQTPITTLTLYLVQEASGEVLDQLLKASLTLPASGRLSAPKVMEVLKLSRRPLMYHSYLAFFCELLTQTHDPEIHKYALKQLATVSDKGVGIAQGAVELSSPAELLVRTLEAVFLAPTTTIGEVKTLILTQFASWQSHGVPLSDGVIQRITSDLYGLSGSSPSDFLLPVGILVNNFRRDQGSSESRHTKMFGLANLMRTKLGSIILGALSDQQEIAYISLKETELSLYATEERNVENEDDFTKHLISIVTGRSSDRVKMAALKHLEKMNSFHSTTFKVTGLRGAITRPPPAQEANAADPARAEGEAKEKKELSLKIFDVYAGALISAIDRHQAEGNLIELFGNHYQSLMQILRHPNMPPEMKVKVFEHMIAVMGDVVSGKTGIMAIESGLLFNMIKAAPAEWNLVGRDRKMHLAQQCYDRIMIFSSSQEELQLASDFMLYLAVDDENSDVRYFALLRLNFALASLQKNGGRVRSEELAIALLQRREEAMLRSGLPMARGEEILRQLIAGFSAVDVRAGRAGNMLGILEDYFSDDSYLAFTDPSLPLQYLLRFLEPQYVYSYFNQAGTVLGLIGIHYGARDLTPKEQLVFENFLRGVISPVLRDERLNQAWAGVCRDAGDRTLSRSGKSFIDSLRVGVVGAFDVTKMPPCRLYLEVEEKKPDPAPPG